MEVYKIVSGGAEHVFFDLESAQGYAGYLLDMQGVIVGIEAA